MKIFQVFTKTWSKFIDLPIWAASIITVAVVGTISFLTTLTNGFQPYDLLTSYPMAASGVLLARLLIWRDKRRDRLDEQKALKLGAKLRMTDEELLRNMYLLYRQVRYDRAAARIMICFVVAGLLIPIVVCFVNVVQNGWTTAAIVLPLVAAFACLPGLIIFAQLALGILDKRYPEIRELEAYNER